MVSGVVLLGKNETYKKILSHRVSRILIVMIGISMFKGICEKSLSVVVSTFFGGLNWYLYAYLAFLLMNFSDNEWKWFILIVSCLNILQAILVEANITFVTFSNTPMIVTPWASVSWHIIFPILGYGLYNRQELVKQNFMNIGIVVSTNFIICIEEKDTTFIKLMNRIAPKLAPLTFGMFLIDTHSGMRDEIYGLFFKEVVDGLHGILAAWWIIIVLLVVYGIIVWCVRLIPIVKRVL